MNMDLKVNISPALTFSWMKINDDHIKLETGELGILDSKADMPEGIFVSKGDHDWSKVKAGCGKDVAALISDVKGDIPLFETAKVSLFLDVGKNLFYFSVLKACYSDLNQLQGVLLLD